MHLLHRDLLKNNYPYWIIKEPEKRPASPIINPDTGLEVKKNVSISVLNIPGSVRNLEESFNIPLYKLSLKEPTPLNLSLCIPKIKLHHH